MIKPLHQIPPSLLSQFSMNGRIEIAELYCDGSVTKPTKWTEADINKCFDLFYTVGSRGEYGAIDKWVKAALDKYCRKMLRCILLGAANQGSGPWYESMLIEQAVHPFVLDYNPPDYTLAPEIKLYDPKDGGTYDSCLSVSSIEHSGLSRYGDDLDPDADLVTMAGLKTKLIKGGLLFLAVPLGLDKVVFNAHRIYGEVRLPLLLKGWKLIDSFGFDPALLQRDTKLGWNPRNEKGELIHPEYPEYCPILVLENT